MKEKTSKSIFPKGFLWGTATSAHQIEGLNKNSDWWEWEQTKLYDKDSKYYTDPKYTEVKKFREYPLEPSGVAADSYNRYEEDFDLCVELNNNAVRISIEWARLEPEEGVWDEKEVKHYRDVLKAARQRNLKTFVTLHHFTNPIWLSKKGGWENLKSSFYFARYAKFCAEKFDDLIDEYITINEPQVYVAMSYVFGIWPPAKRNPFRGLLVNFNFISAHRKAYSAIKSVQKDARVGIVKNIVWHEAHNSRYFFRFVDVVYTKIFYWIITDFFFDLLGKKNDFIGVNYYFTEIRKNLKVANDNDRLSDLNWWINPSGLRKVLMSLRKYNIPIYVTENGLADSKDVNREYFIREMLRSVFEALDKGTDVRGYFHWSLLDNYEWHHGFWPRFGLVEIDYENNQKRTPRQSFYYYAKICKENGIIL